VVSVAPIALDDATSLLLSYAFSGAICPTAGMGVTYSLMAEDDRCLTFLWHSKVKRILANLLIAIESL
jgi:hypothetical protein